MLSFGYSLLVLLSGFSWHMEEHHCMGRMMDRSFFGAAESCGMEQAMNASTASSEDQVLLSNSFSCCEDVSFSVEKQEDLQKVSVDVQWISTPLIAEPKSLTPTAGVPQLTLNSYRPPPLPHGRNKLNWLQVYRI